MWSSVFSSFLLHPVSLWLCNTWQTVSVTSGDDPSACDRGADEPKSVSALQSAVRGWGDSGWNRWVVMMRWPQTPIPRCGNNNNNTQHGPCTTTLKNKPKKDLSVTKTVKMQFITNTTVWYHLGVWTPAVRWRIQIVRRAAVRNEVSDVYCLSVPTPEREFFLFHSPLHSAVEIPVAQFEVCSSLKNRCCSGKTECGDRTGSWRSPGGFLLRGVHTDRKQRSEKR